MKHVVLLYFKEDADPEAIKRFIDLVPGLLADGPFLSYSCGETARGLASSANWGFIAEVEDAASIQAWVDCEPHQQMIELTKPILSRTSNIQFV
jgi:Stress responsive A/B Barrel Domain